MVFGATTYSGVSADNNGDGTCSQGEAWATVEVSIKDDDTLASSPVLELRQLDCPK